MAVRGENANPSITPISVHPSITYAFQGLIRVVSQPAKIAPAMLVTAPRAPNDASWSGLTAHSRAINPIRPASVPAPNGITHRTAIRTPLRVRTKVQRSTSAENSAVGSSRSGADRRGNASRIALPASAAAPVLRVAATARPDKCVNSQSVPAPPTALANVPPAV